MARFDCVVTGGNVVLPGGTARVDLGLRDGRVAAIAEEIPAADADESVDARGLVVLPGAVDPHFHLGIYRNMREDTVSETLSSLVGGVTSVITYFRTGHHYLDRSGPYEEVFPEALAAVAGASRVDFGFHLAPMLREHVREIPGLVARHGVTSFKYYMFYKGMDLAGASRDAAAYTLSDVYDLGHLYEIMEAAAAADRATPGARVSVSVHAEQPELIRLFMERVQADGVLTGLEAYSAGRPPLTERLAIAEAGVLAEATGAPIQFLHLSSGDALEAALEVRRALAGRDVRLETTLHHLALSYESYRDQRGKVNPPIRSEADRERLWQGILRGETRLGLLRPRLLLGDPQGGRAVEGAAGLRRDGAPLPVHADRRAAARPLARAGRGALRRQFGPRVRARAAEGGDRDRRGRGSRARRPRGAAHGDARAAGLRAGVHAVRGHRARRLAGQDDAAWPRRLRGRRAGRRTPRRVPFAAARLTPACYQRSRWSIRSSGARHAGLNSVPIVCATGTSAVCITSS